MRCIHGTNGNRVITLSRIVRTYCCRVVTCLFRCCGIRAFLSSLVIVLPTATADVALALFLLPNATVAAAHVPSLPAPIAVAAPPLA